MFGSPSAGLLQAVGYGPVLRRVAFRVGGPADVARVRGDYRVLAVDVGGLAQVEQVETHPRR
jgi:hypothetical protein